MNRIKKPNTATSESGITLIMLIIMIIILVILTSITIRGLLGSNGLIKETEVVAEDYKISQYRELIDQTVRGTIIAKSAIR